MRNLNVTPAKAKGTPKRGNGKPLANLPANNVGTIGYKLGTTHGSSIVNHSNGQGVAKTGTVNNVGAKLNTTNYVNTGQKAKLGNTKHGVGEAPAYLRNPANPK